MPQKLASLLTHASTRPAKNVHTMSVALNGCSVQSAPGGSKNTESQLQFMMKRSISSLIRQLQTLRPLLPLSTESQPSPKLGNSQASHELNLNARPALARAKNPVCASLLRFCFAHTVRSDLWSLMPRPKVSIRQIFQQSFMSWPPPPCGASPGCPSPPP